MATPSESRLFKPLTVGKSRLAHRIAMPPLTRFRADNEHVPTPMMAEYYAQRASVPGTLIIAEATFIAKSSGGMINVPGIWSDAQVAGWKVVVDAVHAKGSFIYLQLWSLGRAAFADVAAAEGFVVKSASNLPISDDLAVPEPMTVEEIRAKTEEYAAAARNAMAAGFDGVEIHSANGYLLDQFVQDNSNNRTDCYGGSIENRARFTMEVVKAVTDAVGADRVGIRLSPWSVFQGMRMADPVPQFSYLVREIAKFDLAFLHLVRAGISGASTADQADVARAQDESLDFAVNLWPMDKPLLIAGGLTPETARKMVEEEYPEHQVVALFGRHFISTPDLVFRVKEGIKFNPYDRATFYNHMSAVGYLDQEFSQKFESVYGIKGEARELN